jgi:hypothetical protein
VSITRRAMLQGALVAAATLATGTSNAIAVPPRALLVYDSRLPQSCALRSAYAGRVLDLAYEQVNLWRNLRNLRPGVRVVGLTSWSDYVQVRSLLEERRSRLRAETRFGRLFYWEMA